MARWPALKDQACACGITLDLPRNRVLWIDQSCSLNAVDLSTGALTVLIDWAGDFHFKPRFASAATLEYPVAVEMEMEMEMGLFCRLTVSPGNPGTTRRVCVCVRLAAARIPCPKGRERRALNGAARDESFIGIILVSTRTRTHIKTADPTTTDVNSTIVRTQSKVKGNAVGGGDGTGRQRRGTSS